MRYIAMALVVIALLGCSLAGDLGWLSEEDGSAWDLTATLGLIFFVVLVVRGENPNG